MAFYCVASKKTEFKSLSGNFDVSYPCEADFYLDHLKNHAEDPEPFSMLVHTFCRESLTPHRLLYLSHNFIIYAVFEREEYYAFQNYMLFHQHSDYKMIYCLEGRFEQRVEENEHCSKPNDVCFLKPYVMHCEKYEKDFQILTYSFREDYLCYVFPQIKNKYSWGEGMGMQMFEIASYPSHLMRKDYTNFYYINSSHIWLNLMNVKEILENAVELLLFPIPSVYVLLDLTAFQVLCLLNDPTLYQMEAKKINPRSGVRIFARITDLLERSCGGITRLSCGGQFFC